MTDIRFNSMALRNVADEVEIGLTHAISENLADNLQEMIEQQMTNKPDDGFEALEHALDELQEAVADGCHDQCGAAELDRANSAVSMWRGRILAAFREAEARGVERAAALVEHSDERVCERVLRRFAAGIRGPA